MLFYSIIHLLSFCATFCFQIRLSKADEYNSAPYYWFLNNVNGQFTKSINEILTNDEKQLPQGNPTKILTQTSRENGEWVYSDDNNGISEICIYNYNNNESTINNYTDNSIPISTCYKNNWWYIVLKSEAFGVPSKAEDKNYQDDRADALVKVLGAHLEISEIKYYPKECWEQELKKTEESKTTINLT